MEPKEPNESVRETIVAISKKKILLKVTDSSATFPSKQLLLPNLQKTYQIKKAEPGYNTQP